MAWGKPHQLKTDNGPGYISQPFKAFLQQLDIHLIHGIPYNPQGQGVVECAHLTIKNALYKQKGGIGGTFRSPKDKLNTILFILNFLTLEKTGKSAADRHASDAAASLKPLVLWKDILTGK